MNETWPDLATPRWQETAASLQLWSQIVGKTRLAFEPMVNHWWQVPLYVSSCGLTTGVLHDGERSFEVEMDLAAHRLRLRDAKGRTPSFPLEPMSVAEFYRRYREALASIGVAPRIRPYPVEMVEAIPFDRDDVHHSYDPAWAEALATALRRVDPIFKEFRGRFSGKSSPVHFFWGGFDLAVTRFSGRTAPPHPGGIPNTPDRVMREAYSHEVSSAGFWPGNAKSAPVFYSYAYPEPEGYARSVIRPEAAYYDATWCEFMLPYEAVRRSSDPVRDIRDFLQTTYEAAANLAHWDRNTLERCLGNRHA